MTAVELFSNAQTYENHSALLNASVALRRKPEHIFPDMLAIDDGQNSWYRSFDQKAAVTREAIAVAQKGAFSSLLSVLGLSSAMKPPIRSIYPNIPYKLRQLFHQIINPTQTENNIPLTVMWSQYISLYSNKNSWFIPNHFVPIKKKNEKLTNIMCEVILFYGIYKKILCLEIFHVPDYVLILQNL